MAEEESLKDKAKRLVRRARLPRFLHTRGPKKYQTWQFYLCHLVHTTYRLSWRRAAKFMREYYGIRLHWTTWQKAIAKWPAWVWLALGQASVEPTPCELSGMDGTTYTRSDPSNHSLHRIDRDEPVGRPVQAVVLVDIPRRKFLSWRFRATPKGEKRDVPYLMRQTPVRPDLVLMDKGFDSEPLHQFLRESGVWSVAPVRKRCRRGRFRKQLRDCFDWTLYWQRNIVECLFSAVKRLFGTHVRARSARMQRAELCSRFIAYNIGATPNPTFY
jgi:transposase